MYTTLFRAAFRGEVRGHLPPRKCCNINPAQQISFVVKCLSENVKIFSGEAYPGKYLFCLPLATFLMQHCYSDWEILLLWLKGQTWGMFGCLEKAETHLTVFQMIPCIHSCEFDWAILSETNAPTQCDNHALLWHSYLGKFLKNISVELTC